MQIKKLNLVRIIICSFVALVLSTPYGYCEKSNYFPNEISTKDKTIIELNGIGYRRVTLFRVKVYKAALYVTSLSDSAEEIIEHSGERRIRIEFYYDIEQQEIQEAITEHFERNNPKSKFFNNFKLVVPKLPAIKENDTLEIIANEEGVFLLINNKEIAFDNSIDFGRDILRIWLGEEPPNSSLKDGLLSMSTDD